MNGIAGRSFGIVALCTMGGFACGSSSDQNTADVTASSITTLSDAKGAKFTLSLSDKDGRRSGNLNVVTKIGSATLNCSWVDGLVSREQSTASVDCLAYDLKMSDKLAITLRQTLSFKKGNAAYKAAITNKGKKFGKLFASLGGVASSEAPVETQLSSKEGANINRDLFALTRWVGETLRTFPGATRPSSEDKKDVTIQQIRYSLADDMRLWLHVGIDPDLNDLVAVSEVDGSDRVSLLNEEGQFSKGLKSKAGVTAAVASSIPQALPTPFFPVTRFQCATKKSLLKAKKVTMDFMLRDHTSDQIKYITSSLDAEDVVTVEPNDSEAWELNDNYGVDHDNGDIVLSGDADGIFLVHLALRKADGFAKGDLKIEDLDGGLGGDVSVPVTCDLKKVQ